MMKKNSIFFYNIVEKVNSKIIKILSSWVKNPTTKKIQKTKKNFSQ